MAGGQLPLWPGRHTVQAFKDVGPYGTKEDVLARRDELRRDPTRVSPIRALERQAYFDYQQMKEGQDLRASPEELANRALEASQAQAAQAASVAAEAGRQKLAAPTSQVQDFNSQQENLQDQLRKTYSEAYAQEAGLETQQAYQEAQQIHQRAISMAMNQRQRRNAEAQAWIQLAFGATREVGADAAKALAGGA